MFIIKKRFIVMVLLSIMIMTMMAQHKVSGNVKDATGEPLIGVSVYVDDKPSTTTDFDGNFMLPSVQSNQKLKFVYVGYKDFMTTVGNKDILNVVMESDDAQLDEVIVVGYGTMKKCDLTGSVSSIGTQKLNEKG